MDFTGKVVLVTGSSRGLGREIALQFAQAGASVAVHFQKNRCAAEETVNLLCSARRQDFSGGEKEQRFSLHQADIGDEFSIPKLVESVVSAHGRIDILVNNAGVYIEQKVDEVDYKTWLSSWRSVMNVNLFGAANLTFCVAELMKKQGGGRVVNVSSRGAFRGEPDAPAYGASKAGMNSMGQSMAKALAPHNIFIATVAPGFIDTEMAQDVINGPDGPSILSQSPLNRIAKVSEVAHGVLFLASEKAAFMTGAILDINGASYLRT